MSPSVPDRNFALELVRVTEAGALAAARWMGRGDAVQADRSAAGAMELMLRSVDMDGVVAMGTDEASSESPLRSGRNVGSGSGPALDVAVDPVDGTRLLAHGRSNAVSAIAAAERGSLFDAGPVRHMQKIAVGRAATSAIDLRAPVERNLRAVARALRKDLDELTVVVLDRPRHAALIEEIRATGARIRLLLDGDIAGALMPATPDSGVDVLLGTGGASEAVIAACALKCLSGAIQCRLAPESEEQRMAAVSAGLDPDEILTMERLVASDDVYAAVTGVTDGELLRGVKYHAGGARTHSLCMRSRSGTVRAVDASHHWEKLMAISQVRYHGGPPASV